MKSSKHSHLFLILAPFILWLIHFTKDRKIALTTLFQWAKPELTSWCNINIILHPFPTYTPICLSSCLPPLYNSWQLLQFFFLLSFIPTTMIQIVYIIFNLGEQVFFSNSFPWKEGFAPEYKWNQMVEWKLCSGSVRKVTTDIDRLLSPPLWVTTTSLSH